LISKEPRYLSNNDRAGAKSAIVRDAVEADRPESAPKWQDYCKNFSEETCARIRKIVEAKITPGYCKPGFALVPTHLSEEQLRICYVMPPLRTPAALAPSPAAPPLPLQNTPVKKAFRDCLITNAKDGPYMSSDGGKSATTLMGETCKAQWKAWHKECLAGGGTDSGMGNCNMQAVMLTQGTLKLVGK
jgi:hypothetical protein